MDVPHYWTADQVQRLLAPSLAAGMVLDDVVEVDRAAGCGHRLYSDRGPVECPCHWLSLNEWATD